MSRSDSIGTELAPTFVGTRNDVPLGFFSNLPDLESITRGRPDGRPHYFYPAFFLSML
jgi:hypothetical protein